MGYDQKYCALKLSTILILSFFALAFGCWFASHQVAAIAPEALQSYPLFFLAITIAKCALTIWVCFALSQLCLHHITRGKGSSELLAWSYAPLLLLFGHISLLWVISLIAMLQLMIVARVAGSADYSHLLKRHALDFLILLLFCGMHYILSTQFSPSHWHMTLLAGPGLVSEEIPVVSPLFKSYALAKQYSFSVVDYTEWAGIMHPPITLASPLLQWLTLIFDLPSISAVAFHQVLAAVNFIMVVAGSFGYYLFLRYAMNLQRLLAVFGGYLFFFGVASVTQMLIADGGVFMSSYVVFPYALLLLARAFAKRSGVQAAWSGAALASQFFLIAPHPEGTIYSVFFLGIFSAGLAVFSRNANLSEKIRLSLTALIAFSALSAFYVLPILYDQLMGNMSTFAHTGDITANSLKDFQPYVKLLSFVAPLSFILLFLQKKLTQVYLSALVLAMLLLGFITLSTNVDALVGLFHFFHISLHLWFPWRICMYFSLSVITITLCTLEAVLQLIMELISRFTFAVKGLVHDV